MFSQQIPLEATTIEVLYFDLSECNASARMADAANRLSVEIGADITNLDIWTNPDAIIAHRVLIGPTIIILADGVEVSRLQGPQSRRTINRFLSKARPAVEQVPIAA